MTQKEMVLQDLKAGKQITPLDALRNYGCFRLASIIHTLRQEGHAIKTETIDNGKKKFASYKLEYSQQGEQYAFA